MRPKIFAALLAALALSVGLFGGDASAQRGRASQQSNNGASRGADQPKRVFVGKGSDSSKGSRVTITSDNPLNDYSAYRSGDRFYVVLPRAAAGAAARGGSGKGYTDMQMQQRGDSVVLSYRVQPGAKPRVEQKFNRLDVVFDTAEGGQQNAAAGRTTAPPPVENRNPATTGQQAGQPATPSSTPNANASTAGERRPATPVEAEAARNAAAQPAGNTAAAPPLVATAPPTGVEQGAQNVTPPAQESAPNASPTAEQQIAQTQPPTTVAPITTTNPATGTQTGTSLGAFLIRNWALALIFALVVVGLGLVMAARRTSTATPASDEVSPDETRPATLDAPRAARLKDASLKDAAVAATLGATKAGTSEHGTAEAGASKLATGTAEVSAAEVSREEAVPLVTAAALVGGAAVGKSRKEARQEAKKSKKEGKQRGKKKGTQADALPLAETPAAETSAAESLVAESPLAGASASVVAEPVVEEVTGGETAVGETAVEETTHAVEDSALEQPVAEASSATPVADAAFAEVGETTAVGEVVPTGEVAFEEAATEVPSDESAAGEEVAAVVASHGVAAEAVEAVKPSDAVTEITLAAPETTTTEPESVAAVKDIAPAFAPESESVQAETRRLLEGESYSRAVVGSRDSMARQMIAAELLSALAGRNAQRRERASAAFIEHGYFDETTRDLREADAPAERAAAARSLAIVGDRAATPHLVAALEDDSIDVRRAAVEALGTLRDPAAVAPLEALLEREKTQRNRIPPRVIRNAVEVSLEAAAEARREAAAAPAVEVEPADAAAVEVAPLQEVGVPTEAAPPVEVALSESADETTVALAPFVEERGVERDFAFVTDESATAGVTHGAQPSLTGDKRDDEEETLVTESRALEARVAEPRAVMETGLRPFAEADAETAEVTEEVSREVAREVAVEHFEPPMAGTSAPQAFESAVPAAEAAPPLTLEEEGDEVTREIAPARVYGEVAPPGVEDIAGEWFDFDVSEWHGTRQPAAGNPSDAAPPVAAEPSTHAPLFESSSGDALGTPATAEAESAVESRAAVEVETNVEAVTAVEAGTAVETESAIEATAPVVAARRETARRLDIVGVEETAHAPVVGEREKGIAPLDEFSTVPASIQQRLASPEAADRAAAIVELSHVDTDEAFQQICAAFDDEAKEVRSAAARALFELRADRAESFTRALREAPPERRRQIGAAISTSGLASEAVSQLTGESREKTYEAFSLLFLMAKAGEVQPLVRAIEGHPNNEVRLAVVKLLALSGQKEILPAFRRLAVRGSLPTEVRSAVMEAIYQISSSQPSAA
jgi:HEAT repeat protein